MTSSTPQAPAGASDAEAAEGRVYTVSGEDWDEIVAAANEPGTSRAASGSSSTWARSTRPPTGCSGWS